jgi:hypothetical protein
LLRVIAVTADRVNGTTKAAPMVSTAIARNTSIKV